MNKRASNLLDLAMSYVLLKIVKIVLPLFKQEILVLVMMIGIKIAPEENIWQVIQSGMMGRVILRVKDKLMENDSPEDEIESCSMAEDPTICEFHISDRNCVQDTVYMITDDYFKPVRLMMRLLGNWNRHCRECEKNDGCKEGGAHTNKRVYQ